MTQKQIEHPLSSFGYRRIPHRIWRLSNRAGVIASAMNDIWLILSGKLTLHRAWQAGYDNGTVAAINYSSGQFNFGVEMACHRIEECNDETPLICRIEAARNLKKPTHRVPA